MEEWYTIRDYAYQVNEHGERVKVYGIEQNARKFATEHEALEEMQRQDRQLDALGSGIRLEMIRHKVIPYPGD